MRLFKKHLKQTLIWLCLAALLLSVCTPTIIDSPTAATGIDVTTEPPAPTSTLTPTPSPAVTLTPPITIEQPPSLTPISTITMTPLDTLEPEKAMETIKTLLREPVDCSAPCFWGIVPGQTTNEEARNIFSHLGLQMASRINEGKGFSSIHHVLDSGLSIRVILKIQNNIVENIQIKMTPEEQNLKDRREWLDSSPETLIKRYSFPSRVDFAVDGVHAYSW